MMKKTLWMAVCCLMALTVQAQETVHLNTGDIVSPEQIPARIQAIRGKLSPENAERLTVSFRADRHAPMGLVSDVKQALQQAYALKINYSATEISP